MNKLEVMRDMLAVLREETDFTRKGVDSNERAYRNSIENRLRHIEDVLASMMVEPEASDPKCETCGAKMILESPAPHAAAQFGDGPMRHFSPPGGDAPARYYCMTCHIYKAVAALDDAVRMP